MAADPTPQQLSDRIDGIEKRVVDLEADDAKVHGFITWIDEKIISNPKTSAALVAIASFLLASVTAWWAARNNSMPGVVSEPTPPAKVAPQEPSLPNLNDIKRGLK